MMTPDVTRAQVIAVVQFAVSVAVALGAPITAADARTIVEIAGVLSGALMGADAHIRHGRAKVEAAKHAAVAHVAGRVGKHDAA